MLLEEAASLSALRAGLATAVRNRGLPGPDGVTVGAFLANLYLLPFDAAVEQAGLTMVRYGDDLCLCVRLRAEAVAALDVITSGLGRLRLALNPNKVTRRVRRPPTDPVNALLNFGYTLTTAEFVRHLTWAGFDARIGLFHGLRYGRESADEARAYVLELNQRLANPRSRLKPSSAVRLVEDRLRHHDLLNVFGVKTETVETEEGACPQLSLTLNEAQWQRRRSFDGFTVLVAHPEGKRSAAELCRTYRAKDAVETDFQVIKSLVKLRPVRHRTDVKVRAHIALCTLALYIQREVTLRLSKEGISAALAVEQLEPCRLSLYGGRSAGRDAYALPQPSPEETTILRRLGLTRLVDQRELAATLTPRSEFGSTENEVPFVILWRLTKGTFAM